MSEKVSEREAIKALLTLYLISYSIAVFVLSFFMFLGEGVNEMVFVYALPFAFVCVPIVVMMGMS